MLELTQVVTHLHSSTYDEYSTFLQELHVLYVADDLRSIYVQLFLGIN